jgi:hypothetical protein
MMVAAARRLDVLVDAEEKRVPDVAVRSIVQLSNRRVEGSLQQYL